MTARLSAKLLTSAIALALCACGGSTEAPPPPEDGTHGGEQVGTVQTTPPPPRQAPPESGPARDVQFPPITRQATTAGLEVNTVPYGGLPLVYLRMVVRSGSAVDPANLPGMANVVAQMLKEGTRSRTSAQLAEAVEFLGADLSVGHDEENVYVQVRALAEHLDEAMALLADVVRNPRFNDQELRRLKARELDRLRLSSQQPRYLARRALYQGLYGEHPYARTDTNPEALARISRRDLTRWHAANFVPSNAFLVAVGQVSAEAVNASAGRHFAGWRDRAVPETTYPDVPERSAREVLIVDRPQSVQSQIYVGNLALRRNDPAYVPLSVANQVLGGSAASRLFMDLREQRSLTYGAYSGISESSEVAPFIAFAAVRNEVTAEAMAGFMEHLDRIVREEPPAAEIADARNFLSDSFPLQIETAARVAHMTEELRVYGFPDDYFGTYRSAIREVTPAQAHAAARQYIRPSQALIVAVGKAADIVDALRRYGPVRVVDTDGDEIQTFEALPAAPDDAPAAATDE